MIRLVDIDNCLAARFGSSAARISWGMTEAEKVTAKRHNLNFTNVLQGAAAAKFSSEEILS